MSLQRTLPWPHSSNPGETFEGWATESRQHSASLRQMLERRTLARGGGCLQNLPTPTARPYGSTNNGTNGQGVAYKTAGTFSLNTMAARNLWPAAVGSNSTKMSPASAQSSLIATSSETGGSLSPLFVEWLMGWPIGWTDLRRSATGKSLSLLQPRGIT